MDAGPGQHPTTRLTAYSSQFDVWIKAGTVEVAGILRQQSFNERGYFSFGSVLELIKTVDSRLNTTGAAQAGFRTRIWAGKNEMKTMDRGAKPLTAKPVGPPSFVIRVERRQNATWQGIVQWLDGKKTQRFRSVLELIYLLEEIVSTAPIPSDDLAGWDSAEDT